MLSKEEYFENLYNTFFPYVYTIVRNHVPIQEDIEDIIAETFLNLWNYVENLDEKSNVKGLIATFARRRVTDFLRKKYSLNIDVISEDYEPEDKSGEDVGESSQGDLIERVEMLVIQLNEKEQKIFKLKYKDKLSNSEIAEQINETTNYVKVTNNRLLKKLKQLWEKQKI